MAGGRGGTRGDGVALVAGACGSVIVAAISLAVSDEVAAELLTGFTAVPILLTGLTMLATRQAHAHRDQRLATARQGALADLSHQALTRPLFELCDDVEEALRWSLPAERCEVTLDPTAVTVSSSPGRIAVPLPGSFGPNGAVSVARERPFDATDLAFLEA